MPMNWNLDALGNANAACGLANKQASAHELKALISTPANIGVRDRYDSSSAKASQARSELASKRAAFNVFAIRLALATLLAAALLSAFGALSDFSKSRQVLSCALSCTVCFTAAMHYAGILSLRSGDGMGTILVILQSSHASAPTAMTAEEAFLQDENVDLLRHSDWLITLPLLGAELCNLLHDSNIKTPPSSTLVAILLVLVVVFGAIFRFPLKGGRLVRQGNGKTSSIHRIFAILSWVVAGGLFAWVVIDILVASGGDVQVVGGSTANSPPKHMSAVVWFTLVWIFYPIVSVVTLAVVVINNLTEREPLATEWVVAKDVTYAILDVVSKAGLAFYIATSTLTV